MRRWWWLRRGARRSGGAEESAEDLPLAERRRRRARRSGGGGGGGADERWRRRRWRGEPFRERDARGGARGGRKWSVPFRSGGPTCKWVSEILWRTVMEMRHRKLPAISVAHRLPDAPQKLRILWHTVRLMRHRNRQPCSNPGCVTWSTHFLSNFMMIQKKYFCLHKFFRSMQTFDRCKTVDVYYITNFDLTHKHTPTENLRK